MGHSMDDIKTLCSDLEVKNGLVLYGAGIYFSKETITEWLKGD